MPSYDDYESNHSSYGGGDDYSNWYLPQWATDIRNDKEFYSQPSWYREKEIEERDTDYLGMQEVIVMRINYYINNYLLGHLVRCFFVDI